MHALVDGHRGRDLGVQLDGHSADTDVNRIEGGKAHLMYDPQILGGSHTISRWYAAAWGIPPKFWV